MLHVYSMAASTLLILINMTTYMCIACIPYTLHSQRAVIVSISALPVVDVSSVSMFSCTHTIVRHTSHLRPVDVRSRVSISSN